MLEQVTFNQLDAGSLLERDMARAERVRRHLANGFKLAKIFNINDPTTDAERALRDRELTERTELIEAYGAENVVDLQPSLELASQHGYYGDDSNVHAYFVRPDVLTS